MITMSRKDREGVAMTEIIFITAPISRYGYKFCSMCGQEKPETAFNYKRTGNIQRMTRCRECGKKYKKELRAKLPMTTQTVNS